VDLITEISTAVSINTPKLSTRTFELKNNYYVVTNGQVFSYYAIKVFPSDENSPLIRLEKSPPVILEGLAIVNKKAYKVTVGDLLRRVIRKSREIQLEALNGRSSKRTTTTTTTSNTKDGSDAVIGVNSSETVQHKNESGTISETEVEISEVADLAWEEQVGSLLDIILKKEGIEGENWEIENVT
jgi:hypothetical protein